jgi:hypothetical protein
MHIMRDMSPFISEFTKGIPISLETETETGGKGIGARETRVVTGWKFEPSLPEGHGIHAPYNKGNTHTLPGFTYFSDRAMQRLPNTEFILHVSRTVLARWNMTEKEYQNITQNPLDSEGRLRSEYVDALAITSEILTAYPTAMNYRGDYADMNTSVLRRLHSLNYRSIHHLEHGTGMTRVPASKPWDVHKKIGTEMFGDAVIDKSGDCEDFGKLIDRMVVGIQACKSTHPLIRSTQLVLGEYQPYSVLSSVTSRNIREAPSSSSKEEIHVGVEVGSAEDLKAGIGAHMWTILLPKSMVDHALRETHGISSSSSTKKKISTLQRKLPPLVLEGTGPALSLLLAKESYHESMHDKIGAINNDLARMEALARMMTGLTTDQITFQSMRDGNKLFSPFTLPIRTNRVIDTNVNERPSPFYRMAVEMFSVSKNESISPEPLVHLHRQEKPFGHSERPKVAYSGARSIPVLLRPRTESETMDPIGYRYGINVTDLVHRREDLFGLLETVRSSADEQRTINNVMRHAPSSPVIRLCSKAERDAANTSAARVEKILNSEDLQRVISRGFMGRPQDLHEVHMYIRQEDVDEEHLRKMSNHFADNGFIGQDPVRVTAESFTKGHHLLRITVPVDVTGVKQLFFESDALAEHLDKPANRQKEFLVSELKKLVQ